MTEKEAYQKKRSAQRREWQAKIEGLKARADRVAAEQQIKFYKEIESLRKKQKYAMKKLDELESAGEVTWKGIKWKVEIARNDLKTAVDQALVKFKH